MTFIFNGLAHCPALGVKVYTVVPEVAVEIVRGLQTPIIPFKLVLGNIAGTSPTQ